MALDRRKNEQMDQIKKVMGKLASLPPKPHKEMKLAKEASPGSIKIKKKAPRPDA